MTQTVRGYIELLQNRLVSNDVPADLRGEYPYQVLEAVLNTVFSDLAVSAPQKISDFTVPVEITDVVEAGVYYEAELSTSPINGYGVISVLDATGTLFPVVQGAQASAMYRVTNPLLNGRSCRLVKGNTIRFTKKPTLPVTCEVIPSLIKIDSSTPIGLTGVSMDVWSNVLKVLRQTSTMREERINNGRQDAGN